MSFLLLREIQHLLPLPLGNGHDAAVPLGIEEGAFKNLFRGIVDRLAIDRGHFPGAGIKGQPVAVDGSVIEHWSVKAQLAGLDLGFKGVEALHVAFSHDLEYHRCIFVIEKHHPAWRCCVGYLIRATA